MSDSYTFNQDLDPTVPDFFCTNSLSNWNIRTFLIYCETKFPRYNYNAVADLFDQSLKSIIKSENDSEIIRVLNSILKGKSVNKQTNKQNKPASTNITFNGAGSSYINNGTIVNNIGSSNRQDTQQANKKQKVNHVDSKVWKVEDEEDVYEAWRQYLMLCDYHKFCLESNFVIECGYSIKCDPQVPKELYNHLQLSPHQIQNPFISNSDFTFSTIECFEEKDDIEDIEEYLLKARKQDGDDLFKYCYTFFKRCLRLFETPNLYSRLSINEASFNYVLIWPLMEFAVNTAAGKLSFAPGEYILESSKTEYKADAVVLFGSLEISLMETSGKLLLNDNCKYGYDHVKGSFGCLSIFNHIFQTYYHATNETALKLKTSFIHARGDELHLWSLELCSPKLYVLKKVYKFTIPKSKDDGKNILAMGNFAWEYKKLLQYTANIAKIMKKEHDNFEMRKMMDNSLTRGSLRLIINTDIEKPVKGAGFGLLLPVEIEGDEEKVVFVEPQ